MQSLEDLFRRCLRENLGETPSITPRGSLTSLNSQPIVIEDDQPNDLDIENQRLWFTQYLFKSLLNQKGSF